MNELTKLQQRIEKAVGMKVETRCHTCGAPLPSDKPDIKCEYCGVINNPSSTPIVQRVDAMRCEICGADLPYKDWAVSHKLGHTNLLLRALLGA